MQNKSQNIQKGSPNQDDALFSDDNDDIIDLQDQYLESRNLNNSLGNNTSNQRNAKGNVQDNNAPEATESIQQLNKKIEDKEKEFQHLRLLYAVARPIMPRKLNGKEIIASVFSLLGKNFDINFDTKIDYTINEEKKSKSIAEMYSDAGDGKILFETLSSKEKEAFLNGFQKKSKKYGTVNTLLSVVTITLFASLGIAGIAAGGPIGIIASVIGGASMAGFASKKIYNKIKARKVNGVYDKNYHKLNDLKQEISIEKFKKESLVNYLAASRDTKNIGAAQKIQPELMEEVRENHKPERKFNLEDENFLNSPDIAKFERNAQNNGGVELEYGIDPSPITRQRRNPRSMQEEPEYYYTSFNEDDNYPDIEEEQIGHTIDIESQFQHTQGMQQGKSEGYFSIPKDTVEHDNKYTRINHQNQSIDEMQAYNSMEQDENKLQNNEKMQEYKYAVQQENSLPNQDSLIAKRSFQSTIKPQKSITDKIVRKNNELWGESLKQEREKSKRMSQDITLH